MATFTKLILSASNNGQHILLSSTGSSSANPIHTTPAGTSSLDEIYLYAYNEATASVLTTLNWGGGSEPTNICRVTLPPQSGRILIADGMLLTNGLTVYGYASASNMVNIDGFVNRIS
jgi:hypothetical protein